MSSVQQQGSTIVVVGAGLMGVGVAQTFAQAGHRVVVTDTDQGRRDEVATRLAAQLDFMVLHDLIGAEAAAGAAGLVATASSIVEALAPATQGRAPYPLMVVEAVNEDLALKQRLFAELDASTPPTTILCSNTSGLSITQIARDTVSPERVCGAHFWNPPHLIPLVEVVYGESTSDSTADLVVSLLEDAGKTPVRVRRDVPGFVGNRLQHALQREAMALVAAGVATAEEVDLVVTQGFGRRLGVVGPLAVCDMCGLDLILQVDSYLLRNLESSPEPSPLLAELVSEGAVGVRSHRGFLEWDEKRVTSMIAARDAALIAALKARDAKA
ncbi:MAG: 3-hydroxyacyl-CoA dehydrogenase family protein [Actinobacteria bacterium]|nr:3-hydroxyacyl-CoA dehydrogenase family protein [Actinomycetota bacterium]